MAKQNLAAMISDREAVRRETHAGAGYAVGQHIPIESIRMDGGTQARAGLDNQTLAEYAETWLQLSREQNGFVKMPPIIVFHDGSSYWLADGFHRVVSYRQFLDSGSASASPRAIRAAIEQGTQRDAILYACGANDKHGLRRTNADKRRAAATLLRDTEWGQWSDSEIGRRVNVDHKTVASVRAELVATGEIPGSAIRQSADGKARDVTGIRESNAKRATLSDEEQQHAKEARDLLRGLSAWDESIQPQVIEDARKHVRRIRGGALRDALIAEIDHAEQTMQPKIPEVADDAAIIAEIRAKAGALGLGVIWEDDTVILHWPEEAIDQLLGIGYQDALYWLAGEGAQQAKARAAAHAPTLADLDSALDAHLEAAGYFWKSASPPTIANNDGWKADAPTVDQALQSVRDREKARTRMALAIQQAHHMIDLLQAGNWSGALHTYGVLGRTMGIEPTD